MAGITSICICSSCNFSRNMKVTKADECILLGSYFKGPRDPENITKIRAKYEWLFSRNLQIFRGRLVPFIVPWSLLGLKTDWIIQQCIIQVCGNSWSVIFRNDFFGTYFNFAFVTYGFQGNPGCITNESIFILSLDNWKSKDKDQRNLRIQV